MAVPSFALVPAAYVLLLRAQDGGQNSGQSSAQTQVLLQLRQNTGFMDGHWACGAAGHVESGESVTTTALRELREELGVKAEPADLIPLTTVHRSNEPGGPALEQRVDFFFTLRTWQHTPQIREPGKTAALEWFNLNQLPEPMPSHEHHVLRLLAAHLDTHLDTGQGVPASPTGPAIPAITTVGFA